MDMIKKNSENESNIKNQDDNELTVSKDIYIRQEPTETQIQKMNSSPVPRTHKITLNDVLSLVSHIDKLTGYDSTQVQVASSCILLLLMIDPNSPAKYYSNATALQEAQE
ncbi:MAG: hypothetical protein EZS28_055957, partial [Streblomastix strix]